MFWNWLEERRRRQLTGQAFPAEWQQVLERNVGYWRLLDDEEREHLHALVQVFVAEKHWEGCGGLELDDEMRVTIAAEACVLLLGRDHSLYADVESILVYPTTVVRPPRAPAVFGRAPDFTEEGPLALLGQAQLRGPVLLVWDAVRRGARNPTDGRNVVFHEFAHKIDMVDGAVDGTPPLETDAEARRWATVCSEAFLALRAHVDAGHHDFLDAYGATNEAEFFAVATESFFERPAAMEQAMPELYALLAGFYRQDPAARVRAAQERA